MNPSFEQALVEVWRQVLVGNAKFVELGKERYPVRKTPKRGLRQMDFVFDGNDHLLHGPLPPMRKNHFIVKR